MLYLNFFSDDENSESDDEVSDDFYSINDENSDTEMKSVIDDDNMETMSMTSGVSEAPIEADKYDLQFDVNEEQNILTKIKGLNLNLEVNISVKI